MTAHDTPARRARPMRSVGRGAVAAAALLAAACAKPDTTAAGGAPNAAASSATAANTADSARGASAVSVSAAQLGRLHVQPVAMTEFQPSLETNGTVAFDADVSTQVLASISGPVTRILVQPGAQVSRGQPLALVSSPDFAAAVAGFRKAQGAAAQARRVADLDQQLWKNDAIARRDLEQAQVDAQAAEADRDAALQQLRSLGVADAQIGALRAGGPVPTIEAAIRAPIEGTVVERLVNPGQLLQAGTTPTFTIADLSTVWVQANVFEADLASVHVGDRADVVTPASPTPLHGTVGYVAALVDPGTKATAVRVVVPNTGRILKRDMFVQVTIHSTVRRTGILAPVSSVLRDEDNMPFVYVERAPGSFARRSVTLGARVGDQYEVATGLQAGDRLITEGGLFVQFAQSQ